MFRTEITPDISADKIGLKTPLLTIGSCFSDHMGARLKASKFDVLSNPFGIVFNPLSINRLLHIANKRAMPNAERWVESQGRYLHYDVHSSLGSYDEKQAHNKLKTAISVAYEYLQKSKWVVITWGTAIVYEQSQSGEIVANCHKVPANQFSKRLLSTNEIVANFESLLESLPSHINILLTVSPIRHLKETLELNSVSKSILRVACHELTNKYSHVHYFPAYELLLDDLRDYRFYKPDMLHPDDVAVDYIWQKFIKSYVDEQTIAFLTKWKKICDAINHRPFNPKSRAHQEFIKKTIDILNSPDMAVDVSDEVAILKQQLIDP